MSYANLILYSSVLPSYDDEGNDWTNGTAKGINEGKKTQGLGFGEFMGLMKGL